MERLLTFALGVAFLAISACESSPAVSRSEPSVTISDPGKTGRRIEEDGVFGNYFPSKTGRPAPAILVLGGSEGGLGGAAMRDAIALQDAGYSVLQLSYFRSPGQPRDLLLVPLETFDIGLDWLKQQPDVDSDRLAVLGISVGAEAGLLLSTRREDVDAAVLGAPSNVAWGASVWVPETNRDVPLNSTAGWSVGGAPYPFVPVNEYTTAGFNAALDSLSQDSNAIIPVERATHPILLVCGELDTLWPACRMSRLIRERSADRNGPPIEILAYEEAGHYSVGTPLPPDRDASILEEFGGTARANIEAQTDSWQKILAFLEAELTGISY